MAGHDACVVRDVQNGIHEVRKSGLAAFADEAPESEICGGTQQAACDMHSMVEGKANGMMCEGGGVVAQVGVAVAKGPAQYPRKRGALWCDGVANNCLPAPDHPAAAVSKTLKEDRVLRSGQPEGRIVGRGDPGDERSAEEGISGRIDIAGG